MHKNSDLSPAFGERPANFKWGNTNVICTRSLHLYRDHFATQPQLHTKYTKRNSDTKYIGTYALHIHKYISIYYVRTTHETCALYAE